MARLPVVHICNDKTANGSRLAMELDLAEGSVILSNSVKPSRSVLKAIRGAGTPTVFVFHENMHWPMCIATAAYVKVLRKKHRIVFDLHDLAEIPATARETTKDRAVVRVLDSLARSAPRLDIHVLTVSRGLARIFAGQTGITAAVAYNIPPSMAETRPQPEKDPRRLVYFGMLNRERLPLEAVSRVHQAGYVLDVYGRISPFCDADYPQELAEAIQAGGGEILGPYSPDDLPFIGRYAGSLMLYANEGDNYTYAMPNKLFQSINARTVCVASPVLTEMRETFAETGVVTSLDEFLDLDRPPADWEAAHGIVEELRQSSADAYLRTIGWLESSAPEPVR